MELTFPMRNIAFNRLYDLMDLSFIKDFLEVERNESLTHAFGLYIDRFQQFEDSLSNVENEILQLIHTSTKFTVDEYFISTSEFLSDIITLIKSDKIDKDILSFNQNQYSRFVEVVNEKEARYFEQPERRYGHLEKYRRKPFAFGAEWMRESLETVNYNYYCIEDRHELINPIDIDKYKTKLKSSYNLIQAVFSDYYKKWTEGSIKSSIININDLPITIFVEGKTDVAYISKAFEFFERKDLIQTVELRERGGWKNLNKLWDVVSKESWDTIPQPRIFLYDCDTNIVDSDSLFNYKRKLQKIDDCKLESGIENLLSEQIIDRAIKEHPEWIDIIITISAINGATSIKSQYSVNNDSKNSLCSWICQNSQKHDFANFNVIIKMIDDIYKSRSRK